MNIQEQRQFFKTTWESSLFKILKSRAEKNQFSLPEVPSSELCKQAPLLIEKITKKEYEYKCNKSLFGFFAGANGVGKNTILSNVMEVLQATKLPYAYTRNRRPDEIDGIDYYFWNDERFDSALSNNEFVWHDLNHHGKKQGLRRSDLIQKIGSKKPFVLDARVLTTQYLLQNVPEAKNSPYISFYILPPSFDEWYRRLVNRSASSPSEDVIERINISLEEFKQAESICEVFIINDLVERAVSEIINFYKK